MNRAIIRYFNLRKMKMLKRKPVRDTMIIYRSIIIAWRAIREICKCICMGSCCAGLKRRRRSMAASLSQGLMELEWIRHRWWVRKIWAKTLGLMRYPALRTWILVKLLLWMYQLQQIKRARATRVEALVGRFSKNEYSPPPTWKSVRSVKLLRRMEPRTLLTPLSNQVSIAWTRQRKFKSRLLTCVMFWRVNCRSMNAYWMNKCK